MLQNKNRDMVFLPIKPKYAQAIMRGEKKVEFRKRFPAWIKKVVVYSSSPEKRILGWFNVKAIEVLGPHDAWKTYGSIGAISKSVFFDYYENKTSATVIKVKNVVPFDENVPSVKELGIVPPQSCCYMDAYTWATLEKYICA